MLTASQIRQIAEAQGLELIAVLGVSRAQHRLSQEAPRFHAWQAAGYAGEMNYLKRPVELFTNLKNFIDEPAAVLVFAVPYLPAYAPRSVPRPPGLRPSCTLCMGS